MLQWMNMKTKKRATRRRRTGTRRRRKNRKKRRKNKGGGGEKKENKNEKDQQKPTKMKGDPVIVISKFLEHNCRGRPKPIYAHSAVTATRPKLRFQLRPFLNITSS